MEITVEQTLQQGIAAHKEGRLQDAERLYRIILQSEPLHPDANHNLGVLSVSVNKAHDAVPLFKNALEANPKIEQFWLSYVDALIKEQKNEVAKQVFEQAKKQGMGGEKLNALEAKLATINKGENDDSLSPTQGQLSDLLEHYQNGRLGEAEKLAVSVTQKFPTNQLAWKVLGAVLKQIGRISESLAASQKSVQLSPKDAEAHSNLGVTLQELGRLDEAGAVFRQAIALKPNYAEAHYNLGNTLKGLCRLEEAEASYRKAIPLKPDYADAHYHLGITLQKLGRLEESEVSYTQAISLKTDHVEARNNLGNTLQELGRLDEAEASYTQAISLKPDFAEAHYNLGITRKELGGLEEAEASYTQAISLKPDFAEAHHNLGMTLQELGRLDEAEASYTQAIALKPDYAEAHINLGMTLQRLGRLDEAEASYMQAIAFKSDFAEAYYNLGVTFKELRRLEEAEASYKQAIALKPDYAEAHSNLGTIFQELGRLDEAEASYTKGITLKPEFAEAYYNLGIILHMKGHVEAGIENLAKANDIDPKLSGSNLVLSVMRARQARRQTEERFDNINRADHNEGLNANPIYLKRSVESELIVALYEMQSREMDEAKNTPVFGNGRCSLNYNILNEDQPIIKIMESDLIGILKRTFKSEIFLQDSFFNIYGAGAGIPPHTHLNKLDKDKYLNLAKQKYSLVYYISVGDQDCSEPGILKLYDPEEEILPYNGMIVIIPAGRSHSAVYGGKTDRVIIGVNFYIL